MKYEIIAKKLNIHQFAAIKFLFQSEDVRVWLNKTGIDFVHVVIDPETIRHETMDKLYDLTFTVEFPRNYDFGQEKQY